jgi:hypothetical protein
MPSSHSGNGTGTTGTTGATGASGTTTTTGSDTGLSPRLLRAFNAMLTPSCTPSAPMEQI